MNKTDKHLYQFGPFRLDAEERLLLRGDEVVSLTPKTFDVLLALVKHPGHLLEKETLLKTVWPDSFVEENNLADNIFKLRKALGEGENGQKFIETVPRHGYRFVAEVKEQNGTSAVPVVTPPPATLADRHAEPPEPSTPQLAPPPASAMLNTEATGEADVKHGAKSGSTGRGRIILVGFLLTLMFVGIGVNSYHSISYFTTAGDPGWLMDSDHRVRTYGRVSSAEIAGLRDGDEIVSLAGRTYENFRQYFETFAHRTPGTAYTIVVRRDGQPENRGQKEQLTLHTAAFNPLIQILVILLTVIPIVFLLTGLVVFLLRRDDKQALLFALMMGMAFVGGWPPFSLLVGEMPWWLTGLIAAGLLVGTGVTPVALHFFLIFPEPSPLLVRLPRLHYYLYPFYLLMAGPFAVNVVFRLATTPERIHAVFFQELQIPLAVFVTVSSLYLFGALLSLAVNYRQASPNSRRKLRLILIGTMAATIPINSFRLLAYLMPSFFKISLSVLWASIFGVALLLMLLSPLTFAYAIVRHKVMPVSLIIRQSLQYLLAKNALRLLLALPLIVVAGAVYANHDRSVVDLLWRNSFWFYSLAAVALGLAYRYNLRDWLDRRFFREAYQQDKLLHELIEEVRQLDSLTGMARQVSRKLEAALHPERFYLFYCEVGRRELSLSYSSGELSRDLRIPAEFELLRFMEYQGGAQDFPFPSRNRLPLPEKEWLASLGASLLVPLRGTDNRLMGLLILGPKKSEIPYTSGDRQLLETLADQIALVYENAQLKERLAKDRRIQQA